MFYYNLVRGRAEITTSLHNWVLSPVKICFPYLNLPQPTHTHTHETHLTPITNTFSAFALCENIYSTKTGQFSIGSLFLQVTIRRKSGSNMAMEMASWRCHAYFNCLLCHNRKITLSFFLFAAKINFESFRYKYASVMPFSKHLHMKENTRCTSSTSMDLSSKRVNSSFHHYIVIFFHAQWSNVEHAPFNWCIASRPLLVSVKSVKSEYSLK